MKKIIFLFSLVLLINLCFMQDCKAQKERIISDFQDKLNQPFDKDTWWLYKAYQQFASSDELKSTDICTMLKKVKVDQESNMNKFYLYSMNMEANCGMKLDSQTMKFMETELQSSKLEDFYKAFVLTAKYQNQKNLSELCENLPEFFDATGSAMADKKQKKDPSYKRSYLIYEMVSICYEQNNFHPTKEFTKKMSKAIKGFVINSAGLSLTMTGMFEKSSDAYITTVGNVLQIYKINKFLNNQEFIDELNNYLNFIMEGKTIYLKPQEKAFVFQLTKLLHSHPKIQLEKNSFELVNDKNIIEIKGQITNYFSQELKNPPKMEIEAKLYQKSQQKAKLKIKVQKDSFAIELPLKDIEVGIYQLEFLINKNEQIIKEEVGIKFTTKAKIQNLKIDTGYQNSMPSNLQYKVNFENKLDQILKTDQNGFIYLKFQISCFPYVKPKQVSAKLINSQYIKSTNQVIAKFNEATQLYSLIIDIGEPDHIQAYKGKYELEIIIADPLLTENIKWKVASIDINFKRELTTRPAEDTDYNLKPEIKHYFAQPLPDPPKFITFGFIFLLAVGICIFLIGLSQLNLNSDKLFKGVSVILFVFCILAYLGVLGLFWIKINIFQTLFLFVILLVPTLITGNFALLAINQKQKSKID